MKPRRKASAQAASRPHEDWLIERLRKPKDAAAYIEAAMEENDQGVLMLALRQVAQAQGSIASVAEKAGMTREATYRMLSDKGNPELRSFTALLAATGLRLSIKPMRKVA